MKFKVKQNRQTMGTLNFVNGSRVSSKRDCVSVAKYSHLSMMEMTPNVCATDANNSFSGLQQQFNVGYKGDTD